ncbi:tRNA (adenosine(37)-N6)-threonylcarbamoyltransferase complex dimerization subunit type 1 TsaB [Massilia sp. PAMC28688]|uniref:tRNA (adenosine(37)-N6)-threonylcarbamoyltransferase complex dimerization subunit type 1 TsaB n=1 Tax=Massilia sp. PAMC28688 TaxID=2861283 RepID=UPI001C62E7C3|nr:tRNA (adenosine(37)-N6)-threonylcarbamoyltransferase complex dimerization subunit type 1 TsaB [Massilia sp. PAMC28688]QYF93615.1 tRNA (adenosine(37)-N6)-threonylcarbamoyltransferase complex dimerization subunit type 1 TsaB [Massilia sp. PAMC28688]
MSTILAIETSSETASCALLHGERLLARASNGVRTHSQSILPMVQELLAEAGIALAECDAIAFGAGPGSFTGVRTACGIAQGLAYGAGLPVIALVTLDAMALACRQQTGATEVLAVLDARMGEVYWAQYRGADLVAGPALCAPEAVSPLAVEGLAACGNGIGAYPEAFAAHAWAAGARPDIMPHAQQIAQLAQAALARGEIMAAADAQPLYLRNKIAYTSAERQVINAAKAAA